MDAHASCRAERAWSGAGAGRWWRCLTELDRSVSADEPRAMGQPGSGITGSGFNPNPERWVNRGRVGTGVGSAGWVNRGRVGATGVASYRAALERWCAGVRSAVFPMGTWWMHTFHGVSVNDVPLAV
jgi:hypothetical protein